MELICFGEVTDLRQEIVLDNQETGIRPHGTHSSVFFRTPAPGEKGTMWCLRRNALKLISFHCFNDWQ